MSDGPGGTVGKALTLLHTLVEVGGEATLARLTRRTGLPKSTAHRLLAMLESGGAVARTETGYGLGELALRVGGMIDNDLYSTLIRPVKPFLLELFEATRHPVSLAVLRGPRVLYLDSIFGHGDTPAVAAGRWAPAHRTAAGRVLLAFAPAARAQAPAASGNFAPYGGAVGAILAREAAGIQERGIAAVRHEFARGLVGLAAPVIRGTGTATAAISVVAPELGLDQVGVAGALRSAAHAASLSVRSVRPVPLGRAAARGRIPAAGGG